LLCLALLWAFIWLPANRSRDQSTSQIPVLETKLAIMRTQAAEVARLTNIPPVAAKAGARVLADPAGLQTVFGPGAQISMTPPGHFRVTIASTPYGAWLEKLDQCLARYRLRIDAVTLTPRSGTGESTDISVELLLVDESAPAAAS
jgi:type II secretory pathway component PulM